ncbi:uncharacterized protein LOC129302730 [Prosopis cineraria]|uniref:uncharacterized protein LOC129302730 n=1 Tax=Prosopis cineraria TaxID=364024 RepID=UPI00240EF80C|nr:uncharacterized protein LOC129302730 [Prosopis cineraria]
MTSTSAKEVFCYLHVDGHFVKDLQGKMNYEGGKLISKLIREGINHEKLLRMVLSVAGVESGAVDLKFIVKFSKNTYINLLNDEGVQHLIKYNDKSAHMYVETNDSEINGAMDNSMEMENLLTWSLPGSPCRQELESISPSLPCSTQNALVPLLKVNSVKWMDLFISVGQTFDDAIVFKNALYKYSLTHRFGYIFVRNSPKKMIVKCNIDGCKWKISAYALGKTTSILCVKKFHNEHMYFVQDNLPLKQKANSRLTSSIIIDAMRGNVEKTSNEIRQDLYKEYGLNLTYRQALRGKDRALEEIHGLP